MPLHIRGNDYVVLPQHSVRIQCLADIGSECDLSYKAGSASHHGSCHNLATAAMLSSCMTRGIEKIRRVLNLSGQLQCHIIYSWPSTTRTDAAKVDHTPWRWNILVSNFAAVPWLRCSKTDSLRSKSTGLEGGALLYPLAPSESER